MISESNLGECSIERITNRFHQLYNNHRFLQLFLWIDLLIALILQVKEQKQNLICYATSIRNLMMYFFQLFIPFVSSRCLPKICRKYNPIHRKNTLTIRN